VTLGSYCADIQRQYPIQIDLKQNVPKTIPAGTALCLFRVVQEALRNVIKHSGATNVDVVLGVDTQVISLTVSDNGVGFEVSNRLASNGIGLLNMRERARMLGGRFEVLSQPTQGTQIAVTVPLNDYSLAQPL
jgi:signal transduction histidine kinase